MHAHQQQQMMHVTSSIPWIFLWSSNQVGSHHRLYEAVTLFYYLDYTCRCKFYVLASPDYRCRVTISSCNWKLLFSDGFVSITFPAFFFYDNKIQITDRLLFFYTTKNNEYLIKTKVCSFILYSNYTKATFSLYFLFQYGVLLTENYLHEMCIMVFRLKHWCYRIRCKHSLSGSSI